MNILIKQATIVDSSSPFHGQIADVFIENGSISQIAKKISQKADREIDAKNLCLSPGWMDIFANFGDPGNEFKETLETGAAAAAAGGYTDVMIIPNTNPPVHNKSGVEYIIQRAKSLPVNIYPIGAVTRNTEGKELAEMYDMRASGALAFSDGIHSIQSAGLLLKALQYVRSFQGTIIQVPDDESINPHGLINEGIISTLMGLPGRPAIAEELVVERDISLAGYAESKIHFTGIASGKSLESIKAAKAINPGISCSVTPQQLYFCDEDLQTYDTNLKINPPLRGREDREALRKGIENGSIDCIATHHLPHEYDSKVLEFEYAKFGMLGLETAYAVLNSSIPNLAQEKWVDLLAHHPRRIFGLKPLSLDKGSAASLTIFDPHHEWTVTRKDIRSKSANSPFLNRKLKGKVIGIINKDNVFLND